jgi:hypothetical protein
MSELVAALCALTSLACAVLLARAWLGSRVPLLFWCMVCFAGLAVNNALLVVHELVEEDLRAWVQIPAALGVGALCFGLIMREERR